MLLDLVSSVVLELVVHIEQNVLPYPIAFHRRIPSRKSKVSGEFIGTLISSPPARCAIFASHETKYFSPSLPSCSASLLRFAASARDSASTRIPSVREASISSAPSQSSVLVPAASNPAPDSLLNVHPQTAPTGCTPHPMNPPQPEHPLYAHSVSADGQDRGW